MEGTGEREDRRRLETPRHTETRRSRSRSRSPVDVTSRSRSRRLLQREEELARERDRLRRLEREFEKEREASLSRRSERRRPNTPLRAARSRSREQRNRPGNERSDSKGLPPNAESSRAGHKIRSGSPSFSANDIIMLLQSIKSGITSQPVNQSATTTKIDSKNILPEFNPSTKNQRVDVWLKKVNECASVYGWDEKTTIHFAMQKLQGLAKTWYESLNTILHTWTEWQNKLLSAFPCEQNYGQSLEDMLRRKSRFSEPIEIYYYEKLALLNQCEITGKRAVDCIIHGISDRTMKSSALALRCTAPEQLLQFLLSNKEIVSSHQPPTFNKNRSGYAIANASEKSDNTSYNRFNLKSVSYSGIFCFNCKEKGHPYSSCPKPLLKCDRCKRIGHTSENCRLDKGSTKADTAAVQKTMCITASNPSAKFNKQVTVNGKLVEAFVDFGSEVTLVREAVLSQLGISHDGVATTMKGFGNGLVQSLGSVSLEIIIDGVKAIVLCRVVENKLLETSLLVGQSYSEQPHVIVYKDATKLQFYDIVTEVGCNGIADDNSDPVVRVRVIGHSKLYGAATIRAATESEFSGSILLNTKMVGKPNEQYIVCGGIHNVKNGRVNVTVTPCAIPCTLQDNFVFSRSERIEIVNRIMSPVIDLTSINSIEPIDESKINMGESVTKETKAKLFDLLQRYRHCFAHDLAGLGCTDVAEMKIDLNSDRPVVYRPYRLSHVERENVREMVGEMLDAGIIKESVSNYASPIILVRKKDGKTRMCVDYRALNAITVKERYPMPIIEDEISRLSGQAWFITLDLMSGYYQVPITEQSKHLTAFVTPDGQYEFNRMPFGLANAPAVFQRMMNHVLGAARFDKATVYIDDLLVFGRNPEECLDRLEEVLKLLEKANLKLNLSKCSFLRNNIDYLGYEISSTGMRPGEVKIKSVKDFPRPENVHGVRQFLGLVSYFRKFIQAFAQLAYPLTKLLKKDSAWEWTENQEDAFTKLKARLMNRPVLAIYNPLAETELHTDASKIGIGAILLQRSEGSNTFQPVAYYSRQTTPEEKNFHSYELETLAVVCALKKFRVFLLGKQFRVVTDCSALRSTFIKRDLIPRIARWWLAFQEFDCTVEYRAGAKMAHVDALSRNPTVDVDMHSIEPFPAIMAISEDDWLLTLQLGDSELCRIREILNCDLDAKSLDYIKQNYVIKNNKLFKCLGGDRENIRWVVPKGARWQVCRMNHDNIGHVGFKKTIESIKKNYWFTKMSRFIKKYVGACIECAYAKKTNESREGLLHPIPKIAIPFHTLHIDHLGPFVKSKRGNTHLLVVVDSFTKYLFIKPVRNTKTQNVIRVLDEIFDTFRTPDRLISDRGSCFTSHAFRKYCLDRGVKHVLNAVASPRANGQVERYNRTILDSLTAQNLGGNEKDWDSKVGRIQWGLNNTLQKTIGRTPVEVMFGTSMNGQVNPILNEITEETRESRDLTDIRNDVKSKIDEEQAKQKQGYDKGRRAACEYKRGDLVKITKTAFQNHGNSTKLLPSYEGPFRIVKVLGNDRYKVAPIPGFEGTRNKRKTTVAADRIRPWIHITALEVDDDVSDAVNDESGDDTMSE